MNIVMYSLPIIYVDTFSISHTDQNKLVKSKIEINKIGLYKVCIIRLRLNVICYTDKHSTDLK